MLLSIVVVLPLFAALYYLLATNSGLVFLVNNVNNYLSDYVKITAKFDRGDVLHGFETKNYFEVNVIDTVIVRADKLELNYNVIDYITKGAFVIDKLDATKLEVELIDSESATDDDDTDDSEFRLDFLTHIFIKQLKLKDFAYLSSIVDVRVDSADLALEAYDDFAQITNGVINSPNVHLKYQSTESEPNNLPRILTFDSGNGAIEKLPTVDLPLDVAFKNLNLKHAKYYMDGYSTGFFDANLKVYWHRTLLTVNSIDITHRLGSFNLKGTMDFVDYFNLDFYVQGQGAKTHYNKTHYQQALYDLTGNFRLYGNLTNLNLSAKTTYPQSVNLKARINPLSNEMPCSLYIKAKSLIYPFLDTITSKENELRQAYPNTESILDSLKYVEEQFKKATVARKHKSITKSMLLEANKDKLVATDIDLSIEGALFEDLHLLLTHNFYGHGFSDLKVKVDTNFNFDRAEFKSVSLVGFLGNREFKAKAEGQLNYSEDLNFEGRASLNCEDANELLPALKGALDFDSKLQFTYLPKEDVINFKVDNLNSDFFLYGEPTSIKIKNLSGDRVKGFSIDTLDFSQVANNIHIKGNLGTKTSIKGNINLEDLSALVPNLKGSFKGNLAVSGDLDKPLIRVRGNSDRISYDDFYVSKLVIDSSYDLDKHKFANTVITDLIRIKKGIKAYRKCTIDISGTLNNHQLTLSCGSATGSYLGAQGGFDKKTSVYQGTLSNLMLVSNVLDPITILEPVKVKYDFKEKQGEVSKVSLSDGFATINFNNTTLVPKGIKTDLVLENLDLSTCEKYLPNHSKLSGKLSLNSHIEYIAGTPNINGELSATQGRLFASNVFLPYKKVYLKLNANEKLLSSQLEVALARDKGQLALNLEVSNPTSTKALKGNLRLNNLALDLFSKVTGSVNSLNGEANANLSVSGSLEKPLIFGDVKLKGDAQPRYNVGSVDDFEFNVNAKGSVGDLKGSFTINETKAYLNGSLDWTDKAYGNLNFNAQNLHLFLLSFGEAMVNVNTNAELDDHLKIKGNISIPKGLIKFNSFGNSGVTPSEDEIFVDEQTNLRQVLTNLKSQELNNDLEIDVKVSLGDELKVNAMGLKADAKGFLNIQKSSTQNQIQGLGKLYLEHGRVDLYGHKFIVNKANANFVGSLDAPQLEAEVVVDPSTVENNVVAGVQVYGTAKKPQITLFSKPTMSENEIVSYLLYGHGLEKNVQNNNSDNSSSQLLMTLGLGTTTGLLNSIVGVFGMDGVQLGSSGNGDDTQVELQTYLTNKIRLSYGYGVFNSVNEFKLRYELLRRLYVELVSSLDQSVDLIYSFDMD